MKPWIAVDIDGVLANMVGSILPILKERGHDLAYEDVKQWEFPLGETTFGTIIDEVYCWREFVEDIEPIEGAVDGFASLRQKYRVACVTARPEHTKDWTHGWLIRNGFRFDDLRFKPHGEKHASGLDAQWLIDDYPVNVKAFLWNTSANSIVFDQPWNRDAHVLLAPYQGRWHRELTWRGIVKRLGCAFEPAPVFQAVVQQEPELVKYASGATRSADCEEYRYDLISPEGTRRLAIRYALGAKKHGDRNWEGGMPAHVVVNHMKRHLDLWLEGDTSDDNMAAVAWGSFALMHYERHRPECMDCGPNVWQGEDSEDAPIIPSAR